ncbi:Conserved hypothetical protein [Clostridium neonatale]|uniref:Uncharacterized protein n=1 Tax=Clostridium neonatale TaxID=137838 RepID=A0AA86JFU5_9CLOT|nr:Conserved hypothetical protein [Clostridium neonatale]CAG9705146.1 Conserved hypothetical protein [Clostridium neonatale]CAG9708856.1 Conserved hypothetical protein [Clostridium neonatale]CAH0438469.1 Conserved hypothetical protein [Clostridium neonatale]CAI3194213.1 Conserved hypothetical protein [Clostridium neonatale]
MFNFRSVFNIEIPTNNILPCDKKYSIFIVKKISNYCKKLYDLIKILIINNYHKCPFCRAL